MSESVEHVAIEPHGEHAQADDGEHVQADTADARSDTTAEDPAERAAEDPSQSRSFEKQESQREPESALEPGETHAPFSAGFFDTDPASTRARRAYFKMILLGTLMVSVAIWCVLTIYWGALWKTFDLVHNIHGCVVVRPLPLLPVPLLTRVGRTLTAATWARRSRSTWAQSPRRTS